MKTAIFTMGTRGDVQPYIYLAQELQLKGIDVVLGSHPCWRSLIEESGVTFVPVGPDINIEKEAAIIRGNTKSPIFSMLKTMKFVFRIIQNSSDDIYKICQQKDLIIVSHSQMGATEAEVLGIPTVNVTLQSEMIPEKLKEKTFKDKMLGDLIGKQMAKPYNKIRKIYHLPKVKSSDQIMSKQLDLIPISKYIKNKNPYWTPEHVLTGFWYQEDMDYQPDQKLKDFLAAGEKPVILALGAMSFESSSENEKLDMFVHAFKKTGKRAIIQGFQMTLKEYDLPENMIAVGSIPHSWLFRQGYLVIHHCGFGTAAASLIYGIPSIPVPHVLDQFGFADQLTKLGVAVDMIQSKDLSEDKIIAAINVMDTNYDIIHKKATELSQKIQAENGLAKAAELIIEVINRQR